MTKAQLLEISTLGGLSIRLAGEPVTGLASRKVEALLVYLACTGRTHPREVLAEFLWEERTQSRAMANLRVALASLRKHLAPYVAITRDTAALNPEAQVWLDVAEMEEKLSGGQLEGAVELYQGDFLEGFYLRGGRGFEEWATVERERHRQQVLDALGDLVVRHLEAGAYRAGIPHARHLLQLDPLVEEGHRQLMRLLAYSGQRGAALAQYEACCQVLRDELGVEPTEETRALCEQIQTGRLEVPAPVGISPFRTVRGYELRECVGMGGFGEVYRAYQPSVGRQVAVKVILPQYADHPDFIRRFEREARLVARMEHPHIVPLYDYWRQSDGAYLVMRWLRGGDLRTSLQGGPWDGQDAARLLNQVAGALMTAHRQGIVHRDVKPENILLDEEGNAYLSDFGIAKDVQHATGTTGTGDLVGTSGYVSPEQVRGEPLTLQSDIYSLGVVMYETLTAEHPFSGATPAEHLTEPLPALGERRPDLPGALDDVLRQATAKEPTERYADAPTFAGAFREVMAGRAGVAVPLERVVPEPGLRHNLPAQAMPFVGRERELAELEHLLAESDVRLVTVLGPGGMGKTRLALQVAERQLEQYPDGVYLVSLASLRAVEAIVPTIAQALGFTFSTGGGGNVPPPESTLPAVNCSTICAGKRCSCSSTTGSTSSMAWTWRPRSCRRHLGSRSWLPLGPG